MFVSERQGWTEMEETMKNKILSSKTKLLNNKITIQSNNKLEDLAILVSSCDSFSDLWYTHFKLLKKNWPNIKYNIYLVTDKFTNIHIDGVTIITTGKDLDFPMRIKYATKVIKENYILLTLDDYFLIHTVNQDNISILLDIIKEKKIHYLSLYNRRFDKEKYFKDIHYIYKINLNNSYAINLYPAIWDKSFLVYTINDNINAWEYEVSLTNKAKLFNANCAYSQAGVFRILDVVRKGKVLNKANCYFKKNNIEIGNRPVNSLIYEFKLFVMDLIFWYTPKPIFLKLKKIAKKFGMKFISD